MLTKDEIMATLGPLEAIPTGRQPSGSLKEKIECLMFDIYGTLFISASGDINLSRPPAWLPAGLKCLLDSFSIERDGRETLALFFETIHCRHEEMKAAGIDFPEVQIDRVWMQVLNIGDRKTARAFAVQFEMLANPVYPMPHLEQLLAACRKKPIRLGIISNAQFFTPYLFQWFLDATMVELGFDPELTFLSYRLGRAKPSEIIYRQAAKSLYDMNIPVESSLYIGNDMLNDIYPAQKAGFKTALFAGDARSLRQREDHPACRTLAPDLIITDLTQILDCI
jgi:putative hydrolase of the HAD superfamily